MEGRGEKDAPEEERPAVEKYDGHCYCGGVRFQVTVPPLLAEQQSVLATYCHCDSCRRAHSAPLYHVVYLPSPRFRVAQGQDLVREFSKKSEPPCIVRAFCSTCGTRLYNLLPGSARLSAHTGFFPALLEEQAQRELPALFRPKQHHLHHEAVLDLSLLHDDLPRK
ncbi:Glutathione-dependent formaldehyde-activating enzyme [Balamuthia mandrillaris]